jgi:hypothetical protein
VNTYLALGAVPGVEKASEAVVAVACSRTGREGIWSTAVGALVRVSHDDRAVTRDLDVPLPVRVCLHRFGNVMRPVGSRLGHIAGGSRRSLSKDRDCGQSREKKPLESDHVDGE